MENHALGHFAAPLPRKHNEAGEWEKGEAWEVPRPFENEALGPARVVGAGVVAAQARNGREGLSLPACEEPPPAARGELAMSKEAAIDEEAAAWLTGPL